MNNKFLVGLSQGNSAYTINGVKYIIKSRFKKLEDKHTLSNLIGKYITSDFAQLTFDNDKGKINSAYVYSTAEKEDPNAVEK